MNNKVALQNLSSAIDSATTSLKRSFNLGTADYFIESFQLLSKKVGHLDMAAQEFNDRQLFEKSQGLRNLLASISTFYESQDELKLQESITELEARSLDLKNYVSIQEDNFEQQFSEINNY